MSTGKLGEKSSTAINKSNCKHVSQFSIGRDRFVAFQTSKVSICRFKCFFLLLIILYQSFVTKHQGSQSYATVIPLGPDNRVTEVWLRQILDIYRSTDDVFRDEFLQGVIFTGLTSGTSLDISRAARQLLEWLGTSWVEAYDHEAQDEIPPPGPYFTAEQHLLEIFKLYNDVQGAFINGLMPTSSS